MTDDTAADARWNGRLLAAVLLVTFAGFRIALHLAPDTDLNVGGYNIHHLFTGLLLVAAGGVPLAIGGASRRSRDLAVVLFGVGLAMALDEWLFLIATDGSNASYLLPVSFWGGALLVGLAGLYAAALARLRSRGAGPGRPLR